MQPRNDFLRPVLAAVLMALLSAVCIAGTIEGDAANPALPPVIVHRAMTEPLAADPEPASQGRQLFESRCVTCHALPNPTAYPMGRWPLILDRMAPRASLSDSERRLILQYLQSNHQNPGKS